jgi:cytochrome d ubiquinol oxidase subunit II
MDPTPLAMFWAAVIALAILAYVILDGFDIGVGILFGPERDERRRGEMLNTIAPFWDGNETWLVVIGAGLFGAFPAVYAVFLGAFYLPVLLMLVGLIFRGVAFEFRYRSAAMQPFWDAGFFYGSAMIAFVQGAAVGALLRGVPVENMQYAGGSFGWLHPFPVLTGIGLMLGYALLGACWIAFKTVGTLQDWAFRRIPRLVVGVFAVLGLAFLFTLFGDAEVARQGAVRLHGLGLLPPILCVLALAGVLVSARARRDKAPFAMAVAFFLMAFLTLAVMIWPFMIPYAITVVDAAAPEQSLRFFFYAGIIVLPVITIYTIGKYWIFRGKVDPLHIGSRSGHMLPEDSANPSADEAY